MFNSSFASSTNWTMFVTIVLIIATIYFFVMYSVRLTEGSAVRGKAFMNLGAAGFSAILALNNAYPHFLKNPTGLGGTMMVLGLVGSAAVLGFSSLIALVAYRRHRALQG